jgi:hypothetical protein
MTTANLIIGPSSSTNRTFAVGKPTTTFAPSITSDNFVVTSGGRVSQLLQPRIDLATQVLTNQEVSFTPPTPEQVNEALGITPSKLSSDVGGKSSGGSPSGGSPSGGNNNSNNKQKEDSCCGESGGQRQIPCPFCLGEMLVKKAGRPFQRISGFLQRSFSIKLPSSLMKFLQENKPVSKQNARKGKCPVCGNKRVILDPSDDSTKWTAAANNLKGKSKEIQEQEAKLAPPCGNRYTVIQGSDLLEVGLGMNDVASYRVDKECSARNGRMTDLGSKETDPKQIGPHPLGAKANHIQGTNPPSSPGGHYVIKCSNKFSLITGAQGIDITTGGPITINGGITQITGPEVTIGTQTGRLVLEGETVNIGGKSIEMAPTDGQVFVKGTLGATGNIMCGGHAHMESASVVNLETTGKNQESAVSAPNNVYGGPAFWGSIAGEGITASLKELASYTLFNTTNPEHAKNVTSLRFFNGLGDNLQNIAYMLRFVEFVPTGICIVPVVGVPTLGLVYNFPHCHAMPDQMHTHETRIPDIKCDADDAASLRGAQGGVSGPAPLHKSQTNLLTVLQQFWSAISLPFVGSAANIQHNTYQK